MTSGTPRWNLERFVDELDKWVERDRPDPDLDLTLAVLPWIQSRMDDPYRGVFRERAVPGLWWGYIPGSWHGEGRVVTCSYLVREEERVVVCTGFGALDWPL